MNIACVYNPTDGTLHHLPYTDESQLSDTVTALFPDEHKIKVTLATGEQFWINPLLTIIKEEVSWIKR
ncbi:hypothetical protein M2132_001835 [Dysgonomonas sp. PH5-45]|uniref:hypothetical protein n=1 Tax=unclassified Dysgonomonas TaxID=2630389 RepID=UPI002473A243|nr:MULTISPECIES: hypothetical protein [unclassified Dysgonomonas]MDH6355492.1 hypothetical protein [Dysgonomonas sp. PH5-45]MDH6388388.1 hypothetical protein [Dysgonomonas sp. PH5-37]